MSFQRRFLLAISVVALSGISTVYATPITNSAGIVSPVFTQSFQSPLLAINDSISTQFAQVNLNSTLYYDGNTGGGSCAFFEVSGNCVTNFRTTVAGGINAFDIVPTFSIFFSTPQVNVDFSIITRPDNSATTFTAMMNGVSVESFSAVVPNFYFSDPGNGLGNYFGFAGVTFDQIQVQTTGSNLALIGNIQLGSAGAGSAVPEPGTVALLGLGIGGLIALRSRRTA